MKREPMEPKHLEHDWFSRPLPANVQLGECSWLYSSFAFSHSNCRSKSGLVVGNNTGLYHGTFFDLGPEAEITIGNYCSLVGVIFATNGRVTIDDYTFIAHDVVIADSSWYVPAPQRAVAPPIVAESQRSNSVEIGRNVWIGAQSIIVGSLRIGEAAIIGAGTLVTHDVPPYTLCAGNPMRLIRSLAKDENPSD
jgi:acetyltransferase-like isoleucine patch superfamily enzyme